MVDKTLYVVGKSDRHGFIIPAVSLITILKNRYIYSYIIFIFHKYSKLTSGSGANFEKYKIRRTDQTQKYFNPYRTNVENRVSS